MLSPAALTLVCPTEEALALDWPTEETLAPDWPTGEATKEAIPLSSSSPPLNLQYPATSTW